MIQVRGEIGSNEPSLRTTKILVSAQYKVKPTFQTFRLFVKFVYVAKRIILMRAISSKLNESEQGTVLAALYKYVFA